MKRLLMRKYVRLLFMVLLACSVQMYSSDMPVVILLVVHNDKILVEKTSNAKLRLPFCLCEQGGIFDNVARRLAQIISATDLRCLSDQGEKLGDEGEFFFYGAKYSPPFSVFDCCSTEKSRLKARGLRAVDIDQKQLSKALRIDSSLSAVIVQRLKEYTDPAKHE